MAGVPTKSIESLSGEEQLDLAAAFCRAGLASFRDGTCSTILTAIQADLRQADAYSRASAFSAGVEQIRQREERIQRVAQLAMGFKVSP